MDIKDRIVGDPEVMGGRPTIRGTRITVEFVLGLLANGWSVDKILEGYPHLDRADILACFEFAHTVVQEQRLVSTAA